MFPPISNVIISGIVRECDDFFFAIPFTSFICQIAYLLWNQPRDRKKGPAVTLFAACGAVRDAAVNIREAGHNDSGRT